jgi:sulfite exporter TauE/SafE
MRRLRDVIDSVMTYAGVMFVLGTILFTAASVGQVLLVLAGLLMVQFGVWRVAGSVLPSTRTNQVLRDAVTEYLATVRELYRLANAQQRAVFDSTAEGLRGQNDTVIEAARRDFKTEAT